MLGKGERDLFRADFFATNLTRDWHNAFSWFQSRLLLLQTFLLQFLDNLLIHDYEKTLTLFCVWRFQHGLSCPLGTEH